MDWYSATDTRGYNKLGKAVNYAQNHHDTLMNYLLDGRCEISNNREERKAKSYADWAESFLCSTHQRPVPVQVR